MKLISMTKFVLEQQEKFKSDRFYYQQFKDNVVSYATFLKQPLTLGMFVPMDENGNILEPLKGCCSGRDCGCMGMPVNVSSREEMDEVLQAEIRVLFKDCIVKKIEKSHKFDIEYYVVYFNSQQIWISWTDRNVEDMIKNNLELTESALKQIGI